MRMSRFFVLLLFLCVVCVAQESRGTITGTVTDPSGAAIPGANVVARNTGTNLETKTTTNEAGIYVLPFLNTGAYTVTATVAGFKSAVKERVDVGLNQRLWARTGAAGRLAKPGGTDARSGSRSRISGA